MFSHIYKIKLKKLNMEKLMANSGIDWIDYVFNYCVRFLYDVANILGITYEEINVWIFCIIWPIASLILFAEIIRLRLKLSFLTNRG